LVAAGAALSSATTSGRFTRTTRTDDLALICANCHRLIHGGLPWLTLDDLRLSL
jgi:predicted HNH restriction endonuclease